MSEQRGKSSSQSAISTRFRNALLVVIAALFTFGGPYLVYALNHVVKMDLVLSTVSGFALFIVGLALVVYLIKKKIIS
jgi:formate hydrogenlyase subunit 3/multisubunit Na+/H+ antiporter MnhD subunit